VPIPFAQRVWALPFLTILAPSERYYEGKARAHKKSTDWMRQALLQIRRWLPNRTLVFVADSSYAVLELLARMTRLPNPITMIVRFRLDAALYEPALPRLPGQLGRTRKKGARLPTLAQVAANPQTHWQRQVVQYWYGELKRTIEITSGTAVWFHAGHPAVPIRWVIVRDPLGKFKTQALLCTDLHTKPTQIVERFVQRWQLEVTYREVREHLGWKPNASGPPWRLPGRRPPCSACFRWSHSSRIAWHNVGKCSRAEPRGTTSRAQPSAMH
jgi:hypothetical protein